MEKALNEKKLRKTQTIRYFCLNGVTSLCDVTITRNVEITYVQTHHYGTVTETTVLDEHIEKVVEYPLQQVTEKELQEYRKSGVSSFVLKFRRNLYHARIPKNSSFYNSKILGAHKCATVGFECERLSTARDIDGGCEKVRNFSRNIENYSWITDGYETFNTETDVFHVARCKHYQRYAPRQPHSFIDRIHARNNLASFYYGDAYDSAPKERQRFLERGF